MSDYHQTSGPFYERMAEEIRQREAKTPSELASATLLAGSPTWPYVLEFAKRMEAKLARNRHKGNREGWINDDPDDLLARLRQETKELEIEIGIARTRMHETLNAPEQAERCANEAADIANFAMMLADWYKARAS